MKFQDQSDSKLLAAYLHDGVEGAFSELFCRHGAMVRDVCKRVSKTDQDADEVVQIAFATLARRGESLVDRTNLAGWLHRTALNTALRSRRDAAVRRAHERAAGRLWATPVVAHPSRTLEREAVCIEVQQAINAVPDPFRVVLILHYLEGRPIRDIARVLGCPAGTAASRLSRGRDIVKARLRRRDDPFIAAALGALLATQQIELAVEPGGGLVRRLLGGTWAPFRYAAAFAILCGGGSTLAVANPKVGDAITLMATNVASQLGIDTTTPAVDTPTPTTDDKNETNKSNQEPAQDYSAYTNQAVVAPEPASFALLSAAAAGMLLRRRRTVFIESRA